MSFKCSICGNSLKTSADVSEHAKKTGHVSFTEESPMSTQPGEHGGLGKTDFEAEVGESSSSVVHGPPPSVSELREKIAKLKSEEAEKQKADLIAAEKQRRHDQKEVAAAAEQRKESQRKQHLMQIQKEKEEKENHRQKVLLNIQIDKYARKGFTRDEALLEIRKLEHLAATTTTKPLVKGGLDTVPREKQVVEEIPTSSDIADRSAAKSALHQIIENLLQFPFEKRYRRLRATSRILAPILSDPDLKHVLIACGFQREDDFYVIHGVLISKLQSALEYIDTKL